MNAKEISIVWFLLRFGVAFTFLYAAISAFINPEPWLAYFPDFIRFDGKADDFLLITWGIMEIVIGIWLVSGWQIFFPSIAASGLLLGIFIFDFNSLPVIFRNVSILSTSIALAVISNPHYHFSLTYGRRDATEIHMPRENEVTAPLPMIIKANEVNPSAQA